MLNGLGIPLRARFERTGSLPDADEAIAVFTQAAAAHADAAALTNLGTALRDRYGTTADTADREAALSAFERAVAVTSAAPAERIMAVRAAAATAASAEPARVANLMETAVRLLSEVAAGPVVTLNVSQFRSDALLLTGDGVTAVDLPGVTPDTVVRRVNAFHQALSNVTDPSAVARVQAQARLRDVLEWLWDTVTEPVLTALGHRHGPAPSRIWWAPGGLLGLLPLHAAGYHTDGSRRTVMDRAVSSYTPRSDPCATPANAPPPRRTGRR